MIVSHLPYGPTAYFTLSDCVMRHDIPDIGTMSEAFPHLIFHNFQTKLGERVSRNVNYCLTIHICFRGFLNVMFSSVFRRRDEIKKTSVHLEHL